MNHYTNQSFRSLQLLNGEAINRIIDEATNGTCEDLHRSLEEWIFDGGRDNKKTYNALLQIRDDWDKCSSEKPGSGYGDVSNHEIFTASADPVDGAFDLAWSLLKMPFHGTSSSAYEQMLRDGKMKLSPINDAVWFAWKNMTCFMLNERQSVVIGRQTSCDYGITIPFGQVQVPPK